MWPSAKAAQPPFAMHFVAALVLGLSQHRAYMRGRIRIRTRKTLGIIYQRCRRTGRATLVQQV